MGGCGLFVIFLTFGVDGRGVGCYGWGGGSDEMSGNKESGRGSEVIR